MPQAVMKEGVICHVEIPTRDVERARSFYGSVLGWTFQSMPDLNYTLFFTREGGIGGGFFTPDEGLEPKVVNYVLVSDLEPFVEKVQEAGGTLVRGRTEVPHVGWFALVTDPDGNLFGLWQSATPLPEPEDEPEPIPQRKAPARRTARPAARAAKKPARKAAATVARKPAKKPAKKAAAKPARAKKPAAKATKATKATKAKPKAKGKAKRR